MVIAVNSNLNNDAVNGVETVDPRFGSGDGTVKTWAVSEIANGFEAMAVLNEDENTGNERTATKINAPVERMPAMFKWCTIGRKYDSCNTDEFWRVSRWCFLAN